MEISVASRKGRHAGTRARNEVVVDDVGIALAVAITSNVATATAPVVDNLQVIVSGILVAPLVEMA